MASIPREIIQKHNKLLVDLCDHINIKDQDYANFITALRNADLPPGRLSRVENEPAKLFQLMQQKGKLKVGDYKVLEEALENSDNKEALELVRKLGSEITQQMKVQGLSTIVAEGTVQERNETPNKQMKTAGLSKRDTGQLALLKVIGKASKKYDVP
ncbi:hypothetical protein CHS0354_005186 [Potamilus streckersoni]|uniref:Uncharacterized protein n=1 Tax=Potamilus streckersoni TaxID=2493646 RepID=A0AAE0RMC4_9BIVA|nr:hypothetical protein CHS0354_005186 [Potamilus streckersoni]